MPFIPFLCVGSLFSSLAGLLWYDLLSRSQKEKADEQATKIAKSLFEKAVDQLTPSQLSLVVKRVQNLLG